MYSVDVARSIGEVGAGEWDALADGVPFVRHRWLVLAERVLAAHRPRYLLVRKDGGLVAAAVCALEHRLHNPVLESRFGRLTRRWPFLQVQAPMTATSGLLGGEGPQRRVLLRAVRSLVRRERLLFCVVDHLPYAAGQPGYSRLGWLPETLLDLTWPSYEAYLDHLPRKRRAEIRRTQRRAAREGIEVRPLAAGPGGEPGGGLGGELGRLLDRMVAAVDLRHGPHVFYRPGLFPEAAGALGADLTVLAAHRHGAPAGCVALLRDGDELVARWIGRDYARTEGTAVYHALLAACVRAAVGSGARRLRLGGAACVRAAVGSGARRLRLGGAAYETKKQFGVRLEPRSRLFAARSATVTRLVGGLGHRLDPPQLPPSST
ncbi:GNAT family N-acetyltransferase [Nonomuraea sp. NPDC052265]|uniref:GNAT family N-acetyltransferase n=1 Tax=Nonomuraea sp. NPDC052265 TaxID=3364374 RepID=UPI0037C9CA60